MDHKFYDIIEFGEIIKMESLLYPAYQKFYSSLKNLENFNKGNNFFENISCLDNFFSEFRNITFVLQKSLAHTKYINDYQTNRDIYLKDLSWFIKKRNEITKEKPFSLMKEITITAYSPKSCFELFRKIYTIEDDTDFSSLIENLKFLFIKIDPIQIFFSASYTFYENNSKIKIYEEIQKGILKMEEFLYTLENIINEKSALVEKLHNQINNITILHLPNDFLFIDDYVFYPQKNNFVKGSLISTSFFSKSNKVKRQKIKNCKWPFPNKNYSFFERFVLLNISLNTTDLLSTIVLIYFDNTFEIDMFNSELKTTFYRKINETANKIKNNKIKEIYFMITYSICDASDETLKKTSVERLKFAIKDILVFDKINFQLKEEEYIFDGNFIKNMAYLRKTFQEGKTNEIKAGKINMAPIVEAFKTKKNPN
jgi:hypothetical protein